MTMGVHASFADILDYPRADIARRLDRCIVAVVGSGRESSGAAAAADALERAREEAIRLGLSRLEESYTAAFDMDPACALYVGHHLFGETRHRSLFLSGLAAMYRDAGFREDGGEPPDHLPTMLRFVDAPGVPHESRRTLVDEAIAPAARAIAEALDRRSEPYALVLRALLAVLGFGVPATTAGQERANP